MIRKSIGKYRILGQQDRGEIGTVYRATDESRGQEVAIKILSADLEGSEVVQRFRAEAAVLATLHHHELPAIYEVTTAEGELLIVMESVRGESLDELSKRSGTLPPARAGYLLWQVLGALGHAHNAGIVHSDIRPSNLIVADSGSIRIIDFGLARIVEAGRSTSDGSLTATPVYSAPEQLLSESVDGRADLYSCGVVLYGLVTGTLPFKASNRPKLMQAILHDPPTPASTYLPDLPDWCETIIKKALAKAPIDRFQTAEEFCGALTNAIGSAAGLPTRALATPAVFEGAPTVVLRPPVRVAPVAPAPKAAAPPPPGPIAAAPPAPKAVPPPLPPPTPAAPPPQRAAVEKPAKRRQYLTAGVVLAVIAAAAVAYKFSADPVTPVTEAPARVPTTSPTATPTESAAAAVSPAPPATTPVIPTTVPAVPTPSSATAVRRRAPDAAPAVPAPAAESAPIVPAPPAKSTTAFANMVFDADAVVADGDKNRERDARLVLADGKITVTERNDRVIATFAFDGIAGISYSTARHPLWNSPAGPAELLRVEGGAFGIRRGNRNWVAFRTSDAVHVVRVRDEDIRTVIAALEARTGRPVERVDEKKD